MVAYTLEQQSEILRYYFENRGYVAEHMLKLLTDIRRRETPLFGFNRTVRHSMFCALFLKIALSSAGLLSFGQLGAENLELIPLDR